MYFWIRRASGGFRAYAYGANNEIVWWTEVYAARAGARNAVSMLRAGAPTAPLYEED